MLDYMQKRDLVLHIRAFGFVRVIEHTIRRLKSYVLITSYFNRELAKCLVFHLIQISKRNFVKCPLISFHPRYSDKICLYCIAFYSNYFYYGNALKASVDVA